MSLYNRKEWKEFRDNVIEADGHTCTCCGRQKNEVVLQVHHKVYRKGKLPWEYGITDCETLCKGCHAAEHGLIQPKIGWDYVTEIDLEDLIGQCQNSGCGNSIRYAFVISHPKWESLEVGTVCCDHLTDSDVASNKRETQNRYRSRRNRFVKSKRWQIEGSIHKITQSLFEIEINEKNGAFYLTIHKQRSRKEYKTLEEAKFKVFDVIESGALYDCFDRRGIKYRKSKKQKTLEIVTHTVSAQAS